VESKILEKLKTRLKCFMLSVQIKLLSGNLNGEQNELSA